MSSGHDKLSVINYCCLREKLVHVARYRYCSDLMKWSHVQILETLPQVYDWRDNFKDVLSVIRQKRESQNEGNKKTKHTTFSKKQAFFTYWYVHLRVRTRVRFSCCLHFENSPFCLTIDELSFRNFCLKFNSNSFMLDHRNLITQGIPSLFLSLKFLSFS